MVKAATMETATVETAAMPSPPTAAQP